MLAFLHRLLLSLVLLPFCAYCDYRDGHFDDYLTHFDTDR